MKKKVRIEMEVTVEIEDELEFRGGNTESQFIADWCSGLWEIKSMDDVYIHAAECMASGLSGYDLDGLGRLNGLNPEVTASMEITEAEIIDGGE